MQGQEWKIVRTKTDDPLNKPVQTMVLFNNQPLGLIQSYSIGQTLGSKFETLLLEIACPSLVFEEVSEEDLKELLNNISKPKVAVSKPISDKSKLIKYGKSALPKEDDAKLMEAISDVLFDGEKSNGGS